MTATTPPLCPCGSGRELAACCEPRHRGTRPADTPEALMRARYSAFALALGDYLVATRAPPASGPSASPEPSAASEPSAPPEPSASSEPSASPEPSAPRASDALGAPSSPAVRAVSREALELAAWARSVTWLGLVVHDAPVVPADADEGVVTFTARYLEGGSAVALTERSRFVRRSGQWLYVDGAPSVQRTKVAPNERCPCGSGRKYKQCHA